jgi:hypothetical protein
LPGVTSIWIALLIGAALAPTDAVFGAGMMVSPAVPVRIRRLINVESGLNDGIATSLGLWRSPTLPPAAARLGPLPERRLIRRSPVIGHQADTTSQA